MASIYCHGIRIVRQLYCTPVFIQSVLTALTIGSAVCKVCTVDVKILQRKKIILGPIIFDTNFIH